MVEIKRQDFANDSRQSENGSKPDVHRAQIPVVKSFVLGNTLISPDQVAHQIPETIIEAVTHHKS